MVLVDTPGLSISIGTILIRIQDLQFITVLKEHSTIAPALTETGYFIRSAEFNMQLAISEFHFGLDTTRSRNNFHVITVHNLPGSRFSCISLTYPLIQVFSVE